MGRKALYGGVAAVPGFSRPQSDAMAGMKQEHTEEEDSDDVFEQWQVEAGGTVRSTPKIEWYFVTEPTDARLKTLTLDGETLTAWPSEFDADEKKSSGSKPRTPKKLEEFDAKRAEIDRRLAELGLLCLRSAAPHGGRQGPRCCCQLVQRRSAAVELLHREVLIPEEVGEL